MSHNFGLTRSFHAFLKRIQGRCTPDQFSEFMKEVVQKMETFRAMVNQLPPGKEKAKKIHKFIQEGIEFEAPKQRGYDQISCTKGCSACCHQTVEITEDEALLLASLVEGGVKIDRDKLKEQAAFDGNDDDWWRLPKEKNGCVFLNDNGTCKVYAHRPINCRKYFVVSPPEVCGQVSQTEKIIAQVFTIPTIEMIASAALGKVKDTKALPEFLFKVLKEK